MDERRVRKVGLMHFHEVDAHKEGLARIACLVEVLGRGLLDVLVQEWNADDALLRSLLTCVARENAFCYSVELRAQFGAHAWKPFRIAVG